jgi:hypothetical protein
MFRMYRVFCATPWEMEAERNSFYTALGQFNEVAAMPKGILFVPVTLTNIRDKRPLQYAIDENIRECSFYILLLSEDWGPVERNFRNDYNLALECAADPALPMQGIGVLSKKSTSGPQPAAGLPEPQATFSTLVEFNECVKSLLSGWLEPLASAGAAT